jgi:molybdopterin-guanine dinucleotide biosynthesis protein A
MGGDVCRLDKSAVVVAAGLQGRFSEDKGLLKLNGKPLLEYVVEAVEGSVDDITVVTDSQDQADAYAKIVPSNTIFTVEESGEPLVAALKGFESAGGRYALLLPFDAPFVSSEVVSLLFDLCVGKTAVITRTPDNEVEPFQAVYDCKKTSEEAKKTLETDDVSLDAMVEKLRGVRFVSTLVIKQLDPDFRTFFRVKTPLDLKKAVVMSKPRKRL